MSSINANTSVEVLLRMRAIGKEFIEESDRAIDELRKSQDELNESAKRTEDTSKKQASAFAALRTRVVQLAGAYVGLQTALRAIALSDTQERAELRLLGILNSQLEARERNNAEAERVFGIAARLQQELRLFGDEELIDAAATILAATGDIDQELLGIETRLRAITNLAVGMGVDLATAARQLGVTLSGQVGELGERLPALRRAAEELGQDEFRRQLQSGLAFDIVQDVFGDVLQTARGAEFIKTQAAINKFNDSLERLGLLARQVSNPALAAFADILEAIIETLKFNRPPVDDQGRRLGVRDDPVVRPGASAGAEILGIFDEELARRIRASISQEVDQLNVLAQERLDALGTREEQVLQKLLERRETLQERLPKGPRPFEQIRETVEAIEALDAAIAELQGKIDASETTDEGVITKLLGSGARDRLADELGLLSEYESQILKIRDAFKELGLETPDGQDFLFVENPDEELEFWFNLALAQASVAETTREVTEAQKRFADSVREVSDRVQSGDITQATARALISDLTDQLRAEVEGAGGQRDEIRAIFEDLVADAADFDPDLGFRIEGLGDQLFGDLDESIDSAGRKITEFERRTAATLSGEVAERVRDPWVQLLEDLEAGEAKLDDFGEAFLRTLQRIANERIVDLAAGAIFGTGQGGETNFFANALNLLGAAILGFEQGGLVPGADLGRDSQIIAARGGEYMVRPEGVRMPGAFAALADINAGAADWMARAIARSAGAVPPPAISISRGIPGYADGGVVDRVGAPGAGTTVLPVALLGADDLRRVLQEDPTVLTDALASNAAANRQAIQSGNAA